VRGFEVKGSVRKERYQKSRNQKSIPLAYTPNEKAPMNSVLCIGLISFRRLADFSHFIDLAYRLHLGIKTYLMKKKTLFYVICILLIAIPFKTAYIDPSSSFALNLVSFLAVLFVFLTLLLFGSSEGQAE
jgi:hypothetical protein